jgi:HSP20 family molecular chaperone IbpA
LRYIVVALAVEMELVDATYEYGVLTVHVIKSPEIIPAKIAVKPAR